jgi:hypothetical protein
MNIPGTTWATYLLAGELCELSRTQPHPMRMRESIRRSLNYSGNLEIVRSWQGL